MRIHKSAVKNWNKVEIAHLHGKLKKLKKHPSVSAHENASYWIVILTAVLTSMIASIVLSTASIGLDFASLMSLTIALGLAFGAIFALGIHELEELELHHHLIYFLTVIVASSLSFTTFMNSPFITLFGKNTPVLPITIFYIIFFSIPYMMKLTEEYHERLDHTVRKGKRHLHKATEKL